MKRLQGLIYKVISMIEPKTSKTKYIKWIKTRKLKTSTVSQNPNVTTEKSKIQTTIHTVTLTRNLYRCLTMYMVCHHQFWFRPLQKNTWARLNGKDRTLKKSLFSISMGGHDWRRLWIQQLHLCIRNHSPPENQLHPEKAGRQPKEAGD